MPTHNPESGIIREQFTAWDSEHYPEFDNIKYLEYKTVVTGLSVGVCSYGYRKGGKWITLKEAKVCAEYKEQ